MDAPQAGAPIAFVVAAHICEAVVDHGDRVDFIGCREAVEMPASGPLSLRGQLALRFARTGRANSFDIHLRVIGPNRTAGPFPARITFPEHGLAGHSYQFDPPMTISVPGVFQFEVTAEGQVLTVVPFVVAPHGTLKRPLPPADPVS